MKTKLIAITLWLTSCGYQNTKFENDLIDQNSKSNQVVLNYATVKSQVIDPSCIRCHSDAGKNSGGINLETYVAVKANIDLIRDAVLSGFMPRNSSLSISSKNLIIGWIDIGAPEMSNISGQPSETLGSGSISKPSPESDPSCVNDKQIAWVNNIYGLDLESNEIIARNDRDRGHDDCDDYLAIKVGER